MEHHIPVILDFTWSAHLVALMQASLDLRGETLLGGERKELQLRVIQRLRHLVSTIASVPKVLAKIMGHELLQFLKPAVLQSIDPAQYGFIPGSSPMHALISMFH
ncbi:hypothetical protein P5673_006758 [Acropora cervicornis]|uniref:Uncharacterized protein n=1 Tax=Acropora cervicornis TaxID=6130 RepID=A0AAD9QX50_ACRCE|nr:hypothetical protein P5673_006758 [Acropora cervicornis]